MGFRRNDMQKKKCGNKLRCRVNRMRIQAKSDTEPRYALIALYKNKLWTAFYTVRYKKIRIISFRRSRMQERKLYYES